MHVKIRQAYIYFYVYPSRGQFHLHRSINWPCIYFLLWRRWKWKDYINQSSAFEKGRDTGQDKKTEESEEVRLMREQEQVQHRISIMSLCSLAQTKTDRSHLNNVQDTLLLYNEWSQFNNTNLASLYGSYHNIIVYY